MEKGPGTGQVLLAASAYVPPFLLVPVILLVSRRARHRFLVYHTRQGLYFFGVAVILMLFLLGLFYVSHSVLEFEPLDNVTAVLVVLGTVTYLVIMVLMVVTVFLRRYAMLPVLGELAGEK